METGRAVEDSGGTWAGGCEGGLPAVPSVRGRCQCGANGTKPCGSTREERASEEQEQRGREIYYSLEIEKMKEIDEWLEQYRQIWEARFEQLGEVLEVLKKEREKSTQKQRI